MRLFFHLVVIDRLSFTNDAHNWTESSEYVKEGIVSACTVICVVQLHYHEIFQLFVLCLGTTSRNFGT
jgi:hypothetical protein